MNGIFVAALNLQRFCSEAGWQFCFIGGIAVQRWGEPRQTVDADLTLLTGFGNEMAFIEPLLARFTPRREDAKEFAMLTRTLLLRDSNKVSLDIAFGALPFEENSVRRATPWRWSHDHALLTCSAEDLIVHKAFAARAQDWADIEHVTMRQGNKLNIEQIFNELRPLAEAKEQPQILTQLRTIFDQLLIE